jgi:hypothetical protein
VKFIVEQFGIDVTPLESGFRRRDQAGDSFVDVVTKSSDASSPGVVGSMSVEEARNVLKRVREYPHEEVSHGLLKAYRKAHRACVKLSLQLTDKLKSLHMVTMMMMRDSCQ